jgi:hypothetical protein
LKVKQAASAGKQKIPERMFRMRGWGFVGKVFWIPDGLDPEKKGKKSRDSENTG